MRKIAVGVLAAIFSLTPTVANAKVIGPPGGDPTTCGDGRLVASGPAGGPGWIEIYWSDRCQANWARYQAPWGQNVQQVYMQIYRVGGGSAEEIQWGVNYAWTDYIHSGYYETVCAYADIKTRWGEWDGRKICA